MEFLVRYVRQVPETLCPDGPKPSRDQGVPEWPIDGIRAAKSAWLQQKHVGVEIIVKSHKSRGMTALHSVPLVFGVNRSHVVAQFVLNSSLNTTYSNRPACGT
jgi:hypothetical protein